MSDSLALITLNQRVIGFTTYFGVSDLCRTAFWPTRQQAWSVRKAGNAHGTCTCKGKPTQVRIVSFYGAGDSWDALACLNCKVITKWSAPYEERGWGDQQQAPNLERGEPLWLPKVDEWDKQATEWWNSKRNVGD